MAEFNNNNILKRNKKLVLYVALAVSLGACGNDNEPESSPVPDGRTALTVQGKIGVKLSLIHIWYKTVRRNVTLKKGRTLEEDFEIEEDAVALDGVVVSANRNETTRRLAPTLVNVVDLKIFENTNSCLLYTSRCV